MVWRVTYTTYEDFEVEAETEDEALKEAESQFISSRMSLVANTWYDEREIECLKEEN